LNVKLLRHAEGNAKATSRQIKHWFESANPNKNLTQSHISKILNSTRPHGPSDIDSVQVQKLQPEAKHINSGKHTKLDSVRFQWQQLRQQRGVAISELLLQEKKVAQFWMKMPIYAGHEIPKFSKG